MAISSISYSSYQNSINTRKNLKNNPQIPENQVAFRGLEKVATKTAPKEGKKLLVPMLTATAAAFAAIGTSLNNFREKQKAKKEFDKEFRIQSMPYVSEGSYQLGKAEVFYNGKLLEFGKDTRFGYGGDVEHLVTERKLKKWAFETIQAYKQSGLSIDEYCDILCCYAPQNTETLLEAYESPKPVKAYNLLPKDVQKMIDSNIKIEVGETHFTDSTYHERLAYDLYSVDGNINGVDFHLSKSYAYWPEDKEMFAKWAKKHISEYKKSGLQPYKYAKFYGEDEMDVKLLLWAYEKAKEKEAREYFKENITQKFGIQKEQIDAYLETLPKEKRVLALQDLLKKGKVSQGFVEYRQK